MEIKDVELVNHEFAPEHFLVTYENGQQVSVPIDPGNKDYQEVSQWYKAKKTKPFKHTFRNTDRKKIFGVE